MERRGLRRRPGGGTQDLTEDVECDGGGNPGQRERNQYRRSGGGKNEALVVGAAVTSVSFC